MAVLQLNQLTYVVIFCLAFLLMRSTVYCVALKGTCHKNIQAICKDVLPYNEAYLPNVRNHTSIEEIDEEIPHLGVLFDCSPFMKSFLCSVYFPQCDGSDTTIRPCQSLCVRAKSDCEKTMSSSQGVRINCDSFPATGVCFDENAQTVTDENPSEVETELEPEPTEVEPEIAPTEVEPEIEPTEAEPEIEPTEAEPEIEPTKETELEPTENKKEMTQIETIDTARCNCTVTQDNQDKDNPSDCIHGGYSCRDAPVKAYINGETVCCTDQKQISYISQCDGDGKHVSTCKCSYTSPPEQKNC